ncbi:flagellar hook protein FlgE [Butyrivibrio sp. NC3005]|uniref:flagellar hook protein FlgE n=1 Tax=Butyrivibrio sp. NC3005 TaxID=1280685 RepID=UPI000428D95A|nr:flagellar hook-basal body complex protein [Butyrivibrio sp. NC3005]
MLRSLWSGVSGLNIHQTELDVIGNNVANVNTNAYKSSSTTFSDVLYQNMSRATAATPNTAAVNAKQVGLGGRVSAIKANIGKQGNYQTTGEPFDMMINGDSFFVVGDLANTETYYTRDGSFKVDNEGYLVNSKGLYLKPLAGGGIGDRIQVKSEALLKSAGEATASVTLYGNIDARDDSFGAEGKDVVGSMYYNGESGQYTLIFNIKKQDDNHYTLEAKKAIDPKEPGETVDVTGTAELEFSPATGKLTSAATANFTIGTTGLTVNLDKLTTYANGGKSDLSLIKGTSNDDGVFEGTGKPEGILTNIAVSKDGTVSAVYSNGNSNDIAQIATAVFANSSGLISEGDNLYSVSAASGEPTYGTVDAEGGSITTGVLESSNVDLADEFTKMITAQRAFQANSRVITTSDSMLQELKQLKKA